jgi:hypothetical protein
LDSVNQPGTGRESPRLLRAAAFDKASKKILATKILDTFGKLPYFSGVWLFVCGGTEQL